MKGLEAGAVATLGAALAGLAFAPFELATAAAVAGGVNGALSGWRGIYRWGTWKGPVALLADSTWGLPMVAAGLGVHAINQVWPGSDYRPELSRRAGYHVYGGGARARRGFVWTVGNVVSNARPTDERRRQMLVRHEALHVAQHRALGPFYPVLYVAWLLAGGVVGTVIWLWRRGSWWSTVETIAYYDNPFETWAYRRDERWPHPRADAALSWRLKDRLR